MALEEQGVAKFGCLFDQDLAHASYLAERITANSDLKLCFPTAINIVCFRDVPGGLAEPALKTLNTEIMVRMQETGIAAVSDTAVQGRHCLRAAGVKNECRPIGSHDPESLTGIVRLNPPLQPALGQSVLRLRAACKLPPRGQRRST
jgi:glutamate/tyrosine decarboxylase-like PLP-dependent enzyme